MPLQRGYLLYEYAEPLPALQHTAIRPEKSEYSRAAAERNWLELLIVWPDCYDVGSNGKVAHNITGYRGATRFNTTSADCDKIRQEKGVVFCGNCIKPNRRLAVTQRRTHRRYRFE